MRVEIYVRPGAARTEVGGDYDGVLVVRVREPADRGKATEASLRAVANALDLPRSVLTLVRGSTSRRKLLEIRGEVDEGRVEATMTHLRKIEPHQEVPEH
jgi:hypothetical protein